jgi:hypothetical protein
MFLSSRRNETIDVMWAVVCDAFCPCYVVYLGLPFFLYDIPTGFLNTADVYATTLESYTHQSYCSLYLPDIRTGSNTWYIFIKNVTSFSFFNRLVKQKYVFN